MKTHMFRAALVVGTVAVLGGAMTLRQRNSVAYSTVSPVQRPLRNAATEFQTEILVFDRKLVKEEPFSATLIIEQFPEGAGEAHATTSLIYRDDEGRTRRDLMQADAPETTTINDPVSGFTYLIQHRNSAARRMNLSPHADEKSGDSITMMQKSISAKQHAGSYQTLPAPVTGGSEKGLKRQAAAAGAQTLNKSESLGEREIEGVATEGTRTKVTIPAGALGNESELQIVTERWYSPKLQTVILIERFDPRVGRSVYRLSGIKSVEPAKSLFSVPGNYKIIVE